MLEGLLFAAAAVGHAAFLVAAMNCVYGQPLPRWASKTIRPVVGMLILAGPLAWWSWYGLAVTPHLAPFGAAQAFAVVCVVMGLAVWPGFTLARLLARRPAAVRAEASTVIDYAKQLGGPPAGPGRKGWLAKLPGNDVFRVEFTTLTLAPPGWPAAWDGLVVLHLSDLHFLGTPTRPFYQAVFARALADGVPDLVCLTGDVVESPAHHRWVVPLLGRLKWTEGAYAILGNHDYWWDVVATRRRLAKVGFTVLGNGWERRALRGLPLTVIGNEVPWATPAADLTHCPADGYRLLLAHTPDAIGWAKRHGVGLMLSGHVHGGQIRLPGLGSIFVPSRYSRRYDQGTFHEPPTLLHVNRGLAGRDPLRYFCRPQVTRLVLRSPREADA